jgi:hypothetical protein
MQTVLALGMLIACASLEAAPKREPLGLDSLLAPMAKVGFKVQKKPAPQPVAAWDSSTYGTQAKYSAAFKSTFKSSLQGNAYYRIWIDEEHFDTPAEAQVRADSVRVMPPGLGGESRKVFPLRRAFAAGNKVFVVRTDVAAYSAKLNAFADGVALLRSDASKRVVDSLKSAFRIRD